MALSRAQKKLLAIRRAERRLKDRLATIDWELDELSAEVESLGELEARGQKVKIELELEAGDAGKDLN